MIWLKGYASHHSSGVDSVRGVGPDMVSGHQGGESCEEHGYEDFRGFGRSFEPVFVASHVPPFTERSRTEGLPHARHRIFPVSRSTGIESESVSRFRGGALHGLADVE